jgi:hypothetical protein
VGNTATLSRGGAVSVSGSASVSIAGSQLIGNRALGCGGAVAISGQAALVLTGIIRAFSLHVLFDRASNSMQAASWPTTPLKPQAVPCATWPLTARRCICCSQICRATWPFGAVRSTPRSGCIVAAAAGARPPMCASSDCGLRATARAWRRWVEEERSRSGRRARLTRTARSLRAAPRCARFVASPFPQLVMNLGVFVSFV